MNPIPLSAPDGRVYAYACGACHHVCGGSERIVRLDGPDAQLVEDSRAEAERCCTCRRCHKPLPSSALRVTLECDDCRAAQEAHAAVVGDALRQQSQAREATLERSVDVEIARLLLTLISETSYDCWFTSWMSGGEYALWSFVVNGPGEWGTGEVDPEAIDRLRTLSQRCGGWFRWDDGLEGPVFVPIEEWRELYSRLDRTERAK